jgi:hypothetical protein
MKKPHNHDGDEMKCKVEEFIINLRRRIEDSPQPVKRIYSEQLILLYTTSPQITPFTLMFHEKKNSLYKSRNSSYPSAPRTIDEVNIQGVWSKTLNSEQCLLHNSKHPVFGTLESLKQLSKCDNDNLVFDGMFELCPNPFYQLYSVHSVDKDLSTPKLYTLLPDKIRSNIYIDF